MKIINLGCGTKTSDSQEVINIDTSILLRIKNNKFLYYIAPFILNGNRLDKYNALPKNIFVHNLKKGIPFDPESIDVCYHSHMLEHFEKNIAKDFLLKVKTILKKGGIHRIVVPDLEKICRSYIKHIDTCDIDTSEIDYHDSYIAALIEQSVRKEAYGTGKQKPFRRFIENILLGDARKIGETHQWMYDRVNLKNFLLNLGYKEVHIQDYNTSLIPNWNRYGLDLNEKGAEYKIGSLYVEAVK
jgi:hypothetical protein